MQASYISSSFFLLVLILNYVVPITTAVRPPSPLMWVLALWTISLGTDCACQLPSRHVWKTWERSTNSFHGVQQGAIVVALAAFDILRITIDTDELTLMFVTMIRSHQIPMILFVPSRWTVIPCGHHQHWTTWLDEANSTGSIMIVQISVERISVVCIYFILGAVNVSRTLVAILVLVVLWVARKTKVLCSTTGVSKLLSTNYP